MNVLGLVKEQGELAWKGESLKCEHMSIMHPDTGDGRGIPKPCHVFLNFFHQPCFVVAFFPQKTPLLTCLNISKTTTFKDEKTPNFSE